MITRIVLLKLAEPVRTPDGRHDVAAHSRVVLERLPGVTGVEVATAADDATADSWDVALTIRFGSLDHVEPYRVHPDHRTYVDEYLRPRCAELAAFNFEG